MSLDLTSDPFPLASRAWSMVGGPATSLGTGRKKVFSFDSLLGTPEDDQLDGMSFCYATFNPGVGRDILSGGTNGTNYQVYESTYATGFDRSVMSESVDTTGSNTGSLFIDGVEAGGSPDTSFTASTTCSSAFKLGTGDDALAGTTGACSYQELIWWPIESDMAGGYTLASVIANQMDYFGL